MASDEGSFFFELRRRNVYRVGLAYTVVSWLVLQVIDVVEPIIGFPEWIPRFVLLILAIGLPIALVFSWAYEMTPDGLMRESDVDRSQSITGKTGKRLDKLIVGVLSMAILIVLVDRFVLRDSDMPPQNPAVTAAQEITATETPSIAVLPFTNMSADENSAYFSDGLADTLLHMLAQISEIRVAARTSSFQFRDPATDITTIAEALKVGTVLEGSVQKAGNKIRVTAQLIEAETGYHLWSGNFDRSLDDVFAIQDEIASEVVAALKVSLLGEEAQKLVEHDTDDVEAYTEYLLGVNALEEYSIESLQQAEQRFRNAVELDPQYALAWARLGYTYMQMMEIGIGTQAEQLDRAHAAASTALDLDPDLALSVAVLGVIEETRGNLVNAEPLLRRAVTMDANSTIGRLYLARFLAQQSRTEEVEGLMLEALKTDPLSTTVHSYLSLHLRFKGNFDGAMEYARRMAEINPHSPLPQYRMAQIEYDRGNTALAVFYTLKAFEIDPDDPELAMLIGDYYLEMLLPDEAADWYDRATEIDPDHAVSRSSPLALDLYDGELSESGLQLARQLVKDRIENRQGAYGLALFSIWHEARRSEQLPRALEFLADYHPEYFDEQLERPAGRGHLDYFIGRMKFEAGQQEAGRALLEPLIELGNRGDDAYTVSFISVANSAAIGDREETLRKLEKYIASGQTPTLWPIRVRQGPVLEFIRDEPILVEFVESLERNAEMQRAELDRLLGRTNQKRGPI